MAKILDNAGSVRIAFLGRTEARASAINDHLCSSLVQLDGGSVGAPAAAVRNRQVHSDRVVRAEPGSEHEADALWTDRVSLALAVYTADCVPVLLADRSAGRIAAVHAGWRGLATGILARGVEVLGEPGHLERIVAWVGPHIGPCCYEVSWEVCLTVAGATARNIGGTPSPSGAEVARPGHADRPCLDLGRCAAFQLQSAGVQDVRLLGPCTRCSPDWWSYRGDGPEAGRNFSLIWLT